jgi:NADPH-dependent curcumin reductase CurA
VGHFGWQTRTVVNADDPGAWIWLKKPYIIPDFAGLPLSLALGVLGMPGFVLLTCIKPVETLDGSSTVLVCIYIVYRLPFHRSTIINNDIP